MSWLLLDAGNTALKWALVPAAAASWPAGGNASRGEDPVASPVQGTLAIDTPALQAALCAELGRALGPSAGRRPGVGAPTAAFGCTVAATDKVQATDAAIRAAGLPAIQWLGAAAVFDHEGIVLRNGYRNPAQLGPDRWHALIGARARYLHGTLAVINAGTATTIDGLGEDGRFLGGVIVPGIELMRASLAQRTARLPLAAGAYVAHPANTDDAIRTGILDAQLGAIERRVQRIGEHAGAAVQVVLSGGNGATLFALLREQAGFGAMALEPDLVLLGLWHRARAQGPGATASRTP